MYPAISPHRSRSRLLDQGLVGSDHCELIDRVRGDLCHYYDYNMARFFGRKDAPGFLPPPYHAFDKQASEQFTWRTRRLDVFLTQAFHGTEIWMGEPGETVSLAESLGGLSKGSSTTCRKEPSPTSGQSIRPSKRRSACEMAIVARATVPLLDIHLRRSKGAFSGSLSQCSMRRFYARSQASLCRLRPQTLALGALILLCTLAAR